MKTLKLIFAFTVLCLTVAFTSAQTITDVEIIENWTMDYDCGGEHHTLEGVVVRHISTHFNPITDAYLGFKHTAHGELLSSSGEVFKIKHSYCNDRKHRTKNQHYNLIGNEGTHLLYMKKEKWTPQTGYVILKEELKCL